MSLSGSGIWEIRPTNGSDSAASGGFMLAGNTYSVQDLAATVATSSAPVVTSATYTFVAGDVGDWLWIASGTNWIVGLYQIASVSAGAATLSKACATTASPTGGSASIDRSQRNGAFVTFDGSTIYATDTGAVAILTLTGYTVTAMDVGNVLQITGGTNFTTGFYQIASVTTGGLNRWTLDRNCSTAAGLAMTGAMGGSVKTIPKPMAAVAANGAAGNKFFVKAEATIATTATITLNAPSASVSASVMPNCLIGYTTTRGDGGKVTIQGTTNSGINLLDITTNGWRIENFILDCNSLGTSRGINNNGGSQTRLLAQNCIAKNFTGSGGFVSLDYVINCEATGGSSAASAAINLGANPGGACLCNVHDNACPGISITGDGTAANFNLVTNNTGASSDGISLGNNHHWAFNNTVYGSGRHGIASTGTNWIYKLAKNNILAKNGGYGCQICSSAGAPAMYQYDGNAYWSNTSGARNNMDDVSTNLVNSVAPYTNTLDVLISGTSPTNDPFTNSAGGDFTLNAIAGAGALLRGTATPGTLLNATGAGGFLDFGCFQHKDLPLNVGMRVGGRM